MLIIFNLYHFLGYDVNKRLKKQMANTNKCNKNLRQITMQTSYCYAASDYAAAGLFSV